MRIQTKLTYTEEERSSAVSPTKARDRAIPVRSAVGNHAIYQCPLRAKFSAAIITVRSTSHLRSTGLAYIRSQCILDDASRRYGFNIAKPLQILESN
jgi:hypothetical protein